MNLEPCTLNLKTAIIILNWNGKTLLEQFLPSVVSCSKGATIYVADNASSDGSVLYVKKHFPQVVIIQNANNGGYAKGYNDALKKVDADIFCLLNSDVEVTPNWLQPIIAEFEANYQTAIIQPKILDFNKKNHFEYAGAAGGFIDKYGYPFCRGRIFDSVEKDDRQYNDNATIFWASGACFFIRASVFEQLNGFDDTYFAHFEEIDLCWRAYNSGLIVRYVSDSIVYHVGGATLNKVSDKKTYLNFRNSLFTITKNAHGFLFGIIFARLTLDGIAALKFLFQLKPIHFAAIIRAHFNYYWHLPNLLAKRRNINQNPDYYKVKSIVWSYFIKKRRHFFNL